LALRADLRGVVAVTDKSNLPLIYDGYGTPILQP
jgi:hypothetical protein